MAGGEPAQNDAARRRNPRRRHEGMQWISEGRKRQSHHRWLPVSRRVAFSVSPCRMFPICIGPPHVARRDVALRSRRERRRGASPPFSLPSRHPTTPVQPPQQWRRCASATTRGTYYRLPVPAGVWCLRLQSHDGPCAALFHIPACWSRRGMTGWSNLT